MTSVLISVSLALECKCDIRVPTVCLPQVALGTHSTKHVGRMNSCLNYAIQTRTANSQLHKYKIVSHQLTRPSMNTQQLLCDADKGRKVLSPQKIDDRKAGCVPFYLAQFIHDILKPKYKN